MKKFYSIQLPNGITVFGNNIKLTDNSLWILQDTVIVGCVYLQYNTVTADIMGYAQYRLTVTNK